MRVGQRLRHSDEPIGRKCVAKFLERGHPVRNFAKDRDEDDSVKPADGDTLAFAQAVLDGVDRPPIVPFTPGQCLGEHLVLEVHRDNLTARPYSLREVRRQAAPSAAGVQDAHTWM